MIVTFFNRAAATQGLSPTKCNNFQRGHAMTGLPKTELSAAGSNLWGQRAKF